MTHLVFDTNTLRYLIDDENPKNIGDVYNLAESIKKLGKRLKYRFYITIDVLFELSKYFNDRRILPGQNCSIKKQARYGSLLAMILISDYVNSSEKSHKMKLNERKIICSFYGKCYSVIFKRKCLRKGFDLDLVNQFKSYTHFLLSKESLLKNVDIKAIERIAEARSMIAQDFITSYFFVVNNLEQIHESNKANDFYLGEDFFKNLKKQFDAKKRQELKENDITDLLFQINSNIVWNVYYHMTGRRIDEGNSNKEKNRILSSLMSKDALQHIFYLEVFKTLQGNIDKLKKSKEHVLFGKDRIKRYNDFYILASCYLHFGEKGIKNWKIITNDYELLFREKEGKNQFKDIPMTVREERKSKVIEYITFKEQLLM